LDFSIKFAIFTPIHSSGRRFPIEDKERIWRLIDVLNEAAIFLRRNGLESPRLNAERLLALVLKTDRVGLYLLFDRPLSETERAAYRELLRRRASGEPLQYLSGEAEFMSLAFRVDPSVLIPRPETEILVEDAAGRLKTAASPRILDAGTGSGCIAVSLAKALPESTVDAVDFEPDALRTAGDNASRHGVADRIRLIRADLREAGFASRVSPPYDAVVSNPPYVSLTEWETLPAEVRDHEPRRALCDEGDGLGFYPVLAALAAAVLAPGGTIWAEVGAGQSARVLDAFVRAGLRGAAAIPDLNGIPRVVRAEK
jgi:release factor glutamine methyltransferase